MSEKCKTNAPQAAVPPGLRRRGGQPGNRNAAKVRPPLSAIQARIRELGRRFRTVLARLEEA